MGRELFEDWADSLSEWERDGLLDVEAVERCERNICPRCGGHLEFIDVVKVESFVIEKDYGAEYCAVRDPP